MKKKRILAWLLALAMVITMLPATAFAGEIEAEDPEALSITEDVTDEVQDAEDVTGGIADDNAPDQDVLSDDQEEAVLEGSVDEIIDLAVTDEQPMFKVVNAYIEKSGTSGVLVFALNATGYEYVIAKDYESAAADGPSKEFWRKYTPAMVNVEYDLIKDNQKEHVYEGYASKYQFRIPLTEEIVDGKEFGVPFVAVSKEYAEKAETENPDNPDYRKAYTARRADISLENKTVTFGNWVNRGDVTVSSNVVTMPVDEKGWLDVTGTSYMNEFEVIMTVKLLGNTYDLAYPGTAEEAKAAPEEELIVLEEGKDTNLEFANIRGKKTQITDFTATAAFRVGSTKEWMERTFTFDPSKKTIQINGDEATPAQGFDYEGDDVKFIGDNGVVFDTFAPMDGTIAYRQGNYVQVTYVPKDTSRYTGLYLGADITFPQLWVDKTYTGVKDGKLTFTVSADYCGKAIPVAIVENDTKTTTPVQYYLAVPPREKLDYRTVEKKEYYLTDVTFVKEDGETFGMMRPEDGKRVEGSIVGDTVIIKYYPKNKTVYKGFYLDADVLMTQTWIDERFIAADADGNYSIAISKDYCGYAVPAAFIKKSDGQPSSQIYFEIPPEKYFTEEADYTAVEEVLAEIPADLSIYTEESVQKLNEAVDAIEYHLTAIHQRDVNQMATDVRFAIDDLMNKDFDFQIKAGDSVITAANAERIENGYNATYIDYMTGQVVECYVPLYRVILPNQTKSFNISLNQYVEAYNTYFYTKEPAESGYSEYVGVAFGEEIMPGWVYAYSNKEYECTADLEDVIRVQTAYDMETWTSDTLYAIELVTYDSAYQAYVEDYSQFSEYQDAALAATGDEAIALEKAALAAGEKALAEINDAYQAAELDGASDARLTILDVFIMFTLDEVIEAQVFLSFLSQDRYIDEQLYTASSYQAYIKAFNEYKDMIGRVLMDSYQMIAARSAVLNASTELVPKQEQILEAGKTSASYNYAALASKAKSFNLNVTGEIGVLTFVPANGSEYISVDQEGNVTTAKGTPAGTYTQDIMIKAAATDDFLASEPLVVTVKVTVKQAKQPMVVKATKKTQTVKYNKTKNQTIKNAVKVTENQGTLTYKINKTKYFSISKKGVITVKAGTPKNTYKVTVSVTAAGNNNYKKGTQKVSFNIKVK